jgi:hypothetical protein
MSKAVNDHIIMPSDAQRENQSQNLVQSPILEPSILVVESSHIERVSSFVRQHRTSISQHKQTWISTASILPFKDRRSRNTSFCSSTSGQVTESESPEKLVSSSPESIPHALGAVESDPSGVNVDQNLKPPILCLTAESYGKLLYQGNADVEPCKIVSLLGKEYIFLK